MRLDFNVLWVEDQPHLVEAQKERIELLIKREGFRLQVQHAPSIMDATAFLSDDIYGDHIDLVLMDYDLGAGGKGDDGIVEVRSIFPYKDIIFYSSQAPDLLSMVAEKRVQGIFCSTRENLTDTVDGLFEALVKKVLDIDHSRGIVMGATSDIDHFINDCLVSDFTKRDEVGQTAILKVIARHLDEKRKSFDKQMAKIAAIKSIADLQQFHQLYSSNDRIRLLKDALEDSNIHIESIPYIKRYMQETIPRRNELAHVRVKIEGFSRKLYDKNNVELTSDQMKSLRKDLLEFQDLFESLSKKLGIPM